MDNFDIPFNRPFIIGNEIENVRKAFSENECTGSDGPFTGECEGILSDLLSGKRVLLTNSCTSALDLSILLLKLRPGEEVILPSYTYVSTANAFYSRGIIPVFVDVDPDTLNIDPGKIEAKITSRTSAIVPVH